MAESELPLYLDGTGDAVRAVLRAVNGGTGNDLSMVRGSARREFVQDLVGASYGDVLVFTASGVATSTTVGDTRPLAIVVQRETIGAFGTGWVAYGGIVEAKVTGTVNAGDRLRVSATPRTLEAFTAGSSAGVAVAVTKGAGGLAWVLVSPGLNFPFTIIDHGGLSGLTDDDHTQHLLLTELGALSADLFLNGTYTSPTGLQAFATDPPSGVSAAFDGNAGTKWEPAAGAPGPVAFIDLGAGKEITLDTIDWDNGGSSFDGPANLEVATSDDGSTYTIRGSGTVVNRTAYRRFTFEGWTARYWRLNFSGTLGGGNPDYIRISGYRRFIKLHDLFGDLHPDVLTTTPPTNGQALVWDSALMRWKPGSIGSNLDGLSDVVVASPVMGQRLRFDGANWVNSAARWEPLTNGSVSAPELIFALGDVVMVEVF
jgi:F5/8 type C domain-containing protein